jgi:hypothetical protein
MGFSQPKGSKDGPAAGGPSEQQADRRQQAIQPGTTRLSGPSASCPSQTDTTGQQGVRSSPRGAEGDPRGPLATESGLTRSQAALPSRDKLGSGQSGSGQSREVPSAIRKWQDKHTPMRNHLQSNPRARVEGVDGRALALAFESLHADCEAAAERSSLERTNLGQKVRFNLQMERFALRPKSIGHPSNVMETLFQQPVKTTIFDAPEYQGPWRHDCAPKWTMGISDASKPGEGGFPLALIESVCEVV